MRDAAPRMIVQALTLSALALSVSALSVAVHGGRAAPSSNEQLTPAPSLSSSGTLAAAAADADHLAQSAEAHRREIASGRARFPPFDEKFEPVSNWVPRTANEHIRSVGVGNAGPEEELLRDGHLIHPTAEPVLSVAECEALVAEAKAAMAAGRTSTFTYTQASKIGEVHVHDLPRAREWLRRRLYDTLFPWVVERFGEPSDALNVVVEDELAVYDALVIAYDASGGGGIRQPMHRDASLISINIALSPPDAFTGGGTYFETLGGAPLQQAQGHAMCHASGARHAGYAITAGRRWVLVVFLHAERAPLHAARCYAQAVERRRAGQPVEALAAFASAVRVAPYDHEARHGLASGLAALGELPAARSSLCMAILLYPACPKPWTALGAMLLSAGRTRAALRHFEQALARTLSPDDDDAWEASVNIALCLLSLADAEADAEARAQAGGAAGKATAGRRWRQRVPEARRHVERAMAAEGQSSNERLQDLLDRSLRYI